MDGEKTLYPSPRGLKVGETVLAAPNASILIGNCLPFQSIPLETSVHNVEFNTQRRNENAQKDVTDNFLAR
jgi:large subunit ribosomal protein L2